VKSINKDETKSLTYRVKQQDVAAFNGDVVHSVCSTFTLAREIEWTTRQFVLDIRDDDEEGIGTHLSIDHKSPAFIGEDIIFTARIETLDKGDLICSYEARVGERLIATGKTGQKILKREKIKKILDPETHI
jgi:fluoroacetyl-CoA thioesterase